MLLSLKSAQDCRPMKTICSRSWKAKRQQKTLKAISSQSKLEINKRIELKLELKLHASTAAASWSQSNVQLVVGYQGELLNGSQHEIRANNA
jgi:hypothetical protein